MFHFSCHYKGPCQALIREGNTQVIAMAVPRNMCIVLAIACVFMVVLHCGHSGVTAAAAGNCKPKLSPIVLSKYCNSSLVKVRFQLSLSMLAYDPVICHYVHTYHWLRDYQQSEPKAVFHRTQ